MEKNPSSFTTLSLLCQETVSNRFAEEEESPDASPSSFVTLISSDNGFSDSEEYVQLLLQKEKIDFSVLTPKPNSFSDLIKIGRLHAITYILKARELLGLEFQTGYLSITYLDRFLSIRTLQDEKPWAMQLLAVGCLSIAAKMQESSSWGLSSFQVGEFRFEDKSIQKMELLILCTLEWKMDLITPFAYLPYFISVLFTKTPPWITLKGILELLMGIVKDVNLMDHYPSALALAAVLMSLDQRYTRNTLELKIKSIPYSIFLDLEDVCSCYFLLQQSERDPSKIPKLLSSPDLSPISTGQMVNHNNSSGPSSISCKRKRLDFDDTENQNQNQGLSNKKQCSSVDT